VQSLVRLNSSVLQARDQADVLFRWSVLISTVNVVAFVVGLQWGIVGVAACYAIANTALQPLNVWLTGRSVGVGLLRFARSIAGVAVATIAMTASAMLSRLLLLDLGVGPAVRLVIVTAVGIAVFALVSARSARELRGDLQQLLRRDSALSRSTACGETPAGWPGKHR
jgi:PST family polysaccharide transporter